MKRITQFDWKRKWNAKVAPHLDHPLVQLALDLGMMLLEPDWKTGDAPYLLGRWRAFGVRKGVPGKLSWYRPIGRCHWIALFSMAVGVLNYPHLDW